MSWTKRMYSNDPQEVGNIESQIFDKVCDEVGLILTERLGFNAFYMTENQAELIERECELAYNDMESVDSEELAPKVLASEMERLYDKVNKIGYEYGLLSGMIAGYEWDKARVNDGQPNEPTESDLIKQERSIFEQIETINKIRL